MNPRNRFRSFLLAPMTAVLFVGFQPTAIAADPPKAAQQQAKAQDRDSPLCKKYVREHRGHPGKGVDLIKVVYVPCEEGMNGPAHSGD